MSYASFSEVQQAQNIENVAVPIYIYSYKSWVETPAGRLAQVRVMSGLWND